ncbi:toxin-antitoxin system YwqK family antitoxin [Neolewinella antarctica]|uniref:Toxin-antitoxin system YwqK family antitoxin n=1 Tax=Neolewinella antarctica TaxID=442734 RepID=A0ABX0X8W3_9BACT|nr:toxin-antitoxin system YwqK family antitoxin [Neolewinella antarctica]NJC25460.1 hypothetical protein [Neolewinella antarctica]
MHRIAGLLLFSTFLFVSCDGLEPVVETDEDGTRHEFTVDPKTKLRQGELREYFPDGELMAEANYRDGELQGQRKLYDEAGNPVVLENYDQGILSGAYTSYVGDGKPSLRGTYVDGAMNGIWTGYYPDGKIREVVNFNDNHENGPFREWYPDGQPKASGNYRDGDNEDGILHLYAEDGALEKVMSCDLGACRTIWTADSTTAAPPGVDMQLPE